MRFISRKNIYLASGIIIIGMLTVFFISGKISQRQYSTTNETTASALENQYADVPVYPQSILIQASAEAPGSIGYIANWTSTQSVRDIAGWFPDELTRLGWSVDVPPDGTVEQIAYIGARKPDTYIQVSMIQEASGLSAIEIRITEPLSDTEEHEEI